MACVLATAIAYALSTGLVNLWPLAWVAPLPILWLALRVSGRQAALAAFLAYTLGRIGNLPVVLAILPPAIVLVTTLAAAVAFASMIVLARAVALRLDLRLYALAFPLFWTAWEELVVMPIGGTAELGFSQTNFLPLLQLASLTGVVGIGFVVTFVPALVATVLGLRERGLPWRSLGLSGVAVVAGVLIYGVLRMAHAPEAGEPLRVGVAVSDQKLGAFRTEDAAMALAVVDDYVRRTAELVARGAQVVVLPEKFVGVTPAYADAVDERFSRAASTGGVWLVAGLNRVGLPTPRNVAAVFAPDGRKVLEYDKIHLVPGYEDAYAPGDRLGILPSAPGPWAVAVCRDLIVPELGRRLSNAGARLVFAPAWDFGADGPVESRVARTRAVEGGFTFVRVAKEGVPTVSDAYGRALFAESTSSRSEIVEVVAVTPGPGGTLYARAGDWFGRDCVAGAAALLTALVIALVRGRRSPQSTPAR